MGHLKVFVLKAKNLPLLSPNGRSQAFCKIVFGSRTTMVGLPPENTDQKKSSNVVWNILAELKEDSLNGKSSITIQVMDSDNKVPACIGTIGTCKIKLRKLVRGQRTDAWHYLQHKAKIKVGLEPIDFGMINPDTVSLNCNQLMLFEEKQIKKMKKIQKTSFYSVHDGTVDGIDRVVAIKEIELKNLHVPIDAWKREIELMKSLQCRYVVKIYGYSKTDSKVNIVMEYMPKGSLCDLLYEKEENTPTQRKFSIKKKSKLDKPRELSVFDRVRMARQCVRCLAYVHSKHYVHNAITTQNFLVNENYVCKLNYFGRATQVLTTDNSTQDSMQSTDCVLESKEDNLSFASDVYSAGLLLYEIFTSKQAQLDIRLGRRCIPDDEDFLGHQIVRPCINIDRDRPSIGLVLMCLDAWIQRIVSAYSSLPNQIQPFYPSETDQSVCESEDENLKRLSRIYKDYSSLEYYITESFIKDVTPDLSDYISKRNFHLPEGIPETWKPSNSSYQILSEGSSESKEDSNSNADESYSEKEPEGPSLQQLQQISLINTDKYDPNALLRTERSIEFNSETLQRTEWSETRMWRRGKCGPGEFELEQKSSCTTLDLNKDPLVRNKNYPTQALDDSGSEGVSLSLSISMSTIRHSYPEQKEFARQDSLIMFSGDTQSNNCGNTVKSKVKAKKGLQRDGKSRKKLSRQITQYSN